MNRPFSQDKIGMPIKYIKSSSSSEILKEMYFKKKVPRLPLQSSGLKVGASNTRSTTPITDQRTKIPHPT